MLVLFGKATEDYDTVSERKEKKAWLLYVPIPLLYVPSPLSFPGHPPPPPFLEDYGVK